MTSVLVAAGFFVAITAALHFSMWAEGWLAAPRPRRGIAERLAVVEAQEEVQVRALFESGPIGG